MKREPLVLAFAIVFPSVMAWLYFVVFSSAASPDQQTNPALQSLYFIGKVIQFGTPILWLWFADRAALRFRKLTSRGIGVGLAFGVAVAIFAFAVYYGLLVNSPAMADAPARIRAKLAEFNAATPARFWALIAFLSIINSFLEEYYWRWFVFGRLRKYVPLFAAIVISSLAFMGHHVIVLDVYFPGRFWSAVVPFSLAIAFGGAVWAWLYHKSGSIVGPWISHLIVDVAVMSIGYDLAFRQ